jgi:hypothetical protein
MTVVGDRDVDAGGGRYDELHRRGGGAGVLQHVGQRLLHDPVHGQSQVVGHVMRVSLADDGDVQAGLPQPFSQNVYVFQAGRRHMGAIQFAGAEHAKQAAHLLQRGAAGVLHVGHRGLGPGRVRVGDTLRGLRLDDHHADVVCHDVVHLPSDAEPLGERGAALAFGLLRGQQFGTLGEYGDVVGPRLELLADKEADQPRAGRGQDRPDDRIFRGQQVRAEDVRDGEAEHGRDGGDEQDAGEQLAAVDRGAVAGDQHGDERGLQRGVRHGQDRDEDRHDQDHHAGEAAPRVQDQAHRGQHHGRVGLQVTVPAHAESAAQAEQRYDQRDRGILRPHGDDRPRAGWHTAVVPCLRGRTLDWKHGGETTRS